MSIASRFAFRASQYEWLRPRPTLSAALALAVPYIAVILVTGVQFRPVGDEGLFHLKVIEAFASAWPELSVADYPSASAPLPYIIWTVFGKMVGFELWKLRLAAVGASYLSTVLFYRLCRSQALPFPLLSTFALLFFPYAFFHGFTIYTISFGLLFAIGALSFYLLDQPSSIDLIKGSLLATLAIYSRQELLYLPFGMLAFEAIDLLRRRELSLIHKRLSKWLILAMPIALVIPLVLLWKGLTPPMHQADHFLVVVLQHVPFLLVFIGFYFFPLVFDIDLSRLSRRGILKTTGVMLLLLAVFHLFPLIYSETPGHVAAVTGIIAHGLNLGDQFVGLKISTVAMLVLWFVGIGIVANAIFRVQGDRIAGLLAVMAGTFLVMMTLTPYATDRYYALVIPILILFFYRHLRRRGLLLIWLSVLILLSLTFSYWQIALKSFDA